MPAVHFDWTVTFGSLIQLIVLLAALFRTVNTVVRKITRRMIAMERRVDMMWAWIIVQMTKDQREQYETWIRQHGLGPTLIDTDD